MISIVDLNFIDFVDLMDLMDLMDFMDFMDLISAFHMDLDWIWIYELVENGLWIGFGL